MKNIIAGLIALLALAAPVAAQDAMVVAVCGTLPQSYTAGASRLPTVDVNGKLCVSTTGIQINNMTDTWNNAATTFTAIKMNVTDTASAAGSLLLDLQVAGTSFFNVKKNGAVFLTQNQLLTIAGGLNVTAGNAVLSGGAGYLWTGRSEIYSPSSGKITMYGTTLAAFSMLQFGGTTSSQTAFKVSSTTLQARLADDSAFTFFQGKIQTDNAYAAGVVVPSGSIIIYDSTGTAYKISACTGC